MPLDINCVLQCDGKQEPNLVLKSSGRREYFAKRCVGGSERFAAMQEASCGTQENAIHARCEDVRSCDAIMSITAIGHE
jgi:hypothetical protein